MWRAEMFLNAKLIIKWFIQPSMNINPVTFANLTLLIFTAVLSYRSYKFQLRTSIREALEQLEGHEISDENDYSQYKVKAILHKFEYVPWDLNHIPWDAEARDKTEILIRFYKFGTHPAAASQATSPGDEIFSLEWRDIEEEIMREEHVVGVDKVEQGIIVKLDTIDSYLVGRVAASIFRILDGSI